jgi:2-hydroxymuconate-semialdehyde hydrolase
MGREGIVASRFIDVGLIRTHYLEAGAGPTLVLLHSGEFGGSAELCWEHNIPALAEHFHVVAPDWIGFGETDKVYDFVSGSNRRMTHLVAFLAAMGIEEADFAGASMGATALVREAASPECRLPIRRMVLASGGGFVPDNDWRRRILDYDGTPEAMRAILEANFNESRWWEDEDYVRRRVESSLVPGAWEVISAARLKAPNVPARSNFGQPDTIPYESVTVPTLIFAGGADKLREPGYHEGMAERIPDSRAIVVAGAGHLLNIERADEFNRAVSDFLSEPIAAETYREETTVDRRNARI